MSTTLLESLSTHLSVYIAAAAALGTAAFTLVDCSKIFSGGVSNCGFDHIKSAMMRFFPEDTEKKDPGNPLQLSEILETLRANWLNGTALVNQKAIAKSLIKLRLDKANAPNLAKATGIDKEKFVVIAEKISTGETLSKTENDLFGRFDLILTAILDRGYQHADQSYRNSAKAWAVLVSVVLAISGVFLGYGPNVPFGKIGVAILLGIVATPIAPVAKDLTSALSEWVKAMQLLRK